MNEQNFLFEVSWEVCNKVGGIYTVLQSKLEQTIRHFGENYILIGPWNGINKEFIELSSPSLDRIKTILIRQGMDCHIGCWDVVGKPTVILVDFKQHHKINDLLYSLWADFGIDSLASNYEYQELVLFATAAGKIISLLAENNYIENKQAVAHFHEWMCGAGVLYLKKNNSNIATVFTTHATVLGRSISQDNRSVSELGSGFNVDAEAKKYGVFAKHLLEKVSAHAANCFTTVSGVTADEAQIVLGKHPDKIVCNGLDVEHIIAEAATYNRLQVRDKLLQIATKVVGEKITDNALLWITSGRYEFHNKGYDLLLKSLSYLEANLAKDAPPIIVFFLVAATLHSKDESLLELGVTRYSEQHNTIGLATHSIYDAENDSIIRLCNEFDFKKLGRKVHVVFSNAYLYGNDGVFDLTYEQVLSACDLSIFPSFYEPWGYTPLESVAYSIPTITTDLSGFGNWVSNLNIEITDAVFVLKRKERDETTVIADLNTYLQGIINKSTDPLYVANTREQALRIAKLADWRVFYQNYVDSYIRAIRTNRLSGVEYTTANEDGNYTGKMHDVVNSLPRLRSFQYESVLPKSIHGLRDLAYNCWWTWHDEAKVLFQKIDPVLWQQTKNNPVHFLHLVASHNLQKAADSIQYLDIYNKIMTTFNCCTNGDSKEITLGANISINNMHPIAYFCMEYGIDECLPIYSGGLGVLAGDYLKAASDLRLPLVAVGLFYKQGYFTQKINSKGEQEARYESIDLSKVPMQLVVDNIGKEVLASVEVLDRNIYFKCWEVKVGSVSLYLLDTDVADNSAEDRDITNSLYGGSDEHRLMQEIILGIGGKRFLTDKLNIRPSLYHLNEGHSAFLLLERIRELCKQGCSFDAAVMLVKSSSVFTIHTPVSAGNEAFAEDLIRKYLGSYVESSLEISTPKLFALANDTKSQTKSFSMTILALRLTLSANAVSRLHGFVARSMWRNIWPGSLESEVPIDAVTNGVHLLTWVGKQMQQLYDAYLPSDWQLLQQENVVLEHLNKIPDSKIWEAHQAQKEQLLIKVKKLLIEQYTMRNESKNLIDESLQCLNNDTLLIGLSRRFAAYKRNSLLLLDIERLAKILVNNERPVVILVAGKAHPADNLAKKILNDIVVMLRDKILHGHVIFIEEYNIGLAKLLVQGVDVWLNTPIVGKEACGTSGMKASINGGLHFSTKDGWWDEAYNEQIGWEIDSVAAINDSDERNHVENSYLLNILDSKIIPLYYDFNNSRFNPAWIAKMKAAMASIAVNYSAFRMVRDYVNNLYAPVVLHNNQLIKNGNSNLKSIVSWLQTISRRFSTAKIKAVLINGVKNSKIVSAGLLKVKILLYIGEMTTDELLVELILLRGSAHNSSESAPIIVQLQHIKSESLGTGIIEYTAGYQLKDTGFYKYGVRILPYNDLLFRPLDVGIVYWE